MYKILVGFLVLIAATFANAATITVNPGQSIQSAITSAAAGDVVLVKAGIYTGGVTLNKAITLRGEPGATLRAAVSGSGDGVRIASDNCTVEGLRIENFSMAITAYNNPKNNVRVLNNHTYRNQFSCWIDGQNWLIEGNEFERAYYWSGTGDCDYTRMFGRGHVFRRNYLHGTIIPTDLAPRSGSDYAHLDGIQWFGNSGNGEVFQNILIEQNYLTDIVQGFYISNPNSTGDIDGVTIRDNVIWGQNNPEAGQLGNRPVWGTLFGSGNGLYPARNVRFENNLLYNIVTHLAGTGGHQGVWQSNIFVAKQGDYSVAYYDEGYSDAGITGNADWLWRVQQGDIDKPINVIADPVFRNEANPLGADGVPWFMGATNDDGWVSSATAQGFGPQVGATPPPTPTNNPPVANAGPDQALDVYPGQTVMVTLQGSGTDSDGTIALYQWGPNGETTQQIQTALGVGTHTFSLRVVDNMGTMSDPDLVVVTITEIGIPNDHEQRITDLEAQVQTLIQQNAAQQATIDALDAFVKKYPIEVRVKDNRSGQTGQRGVPGRVW